MYYVIVNPASKSGRGRCIWAGLEPIFKEKDIPYKVVFSKEAGHVARIVAKLTAPLIGQTDPAPVKLIILGGDGTMNEALQGIRDFDKVWFGYIPTGSSNDLARDLGLPKAPEAILHAILRGSVKRTMDLGILTYDNISGERSRLHAEELSATRYFAVSSGIGFDAAVCEEALASKSKTALNKLGLGKLTYLVIALKQLITAKSVSCDIYLEEAAEPVHLNRFLFTAFMLHKYEGGGFKFCPSADASDGLLDICVIGGLPKLIMLLALPTAFFGKHYLFPHIEHYRAAKVRLTASEPLWVHTDGEVYMKCNGISVACAPGKIKLMM